MNVSGFSFLRRSEASWWTGLPLASSVSALMSVTQTCVSGVGLSDNRVTGALTGVSTGVNKLAFRVEIARCPETLDLGACGSLQDLRRPPSTCRAQQRQAIPHRYLAWGVTTRTRATQV